MASRDVTLHHDRTQALHAVRNHPEHPGRVDAVLQHLAEIGAMDLLRQAPPRAATEAELALAHSPEHVEHIHRLDGSGGRSIDPDTAVVPGSYEAAVHAAGCLLAATDAVLAGNADAAYCLVRPPGHHATRDRAMGFCLFNNVAIAAAYALSRHGVERLAIVDFDVHHGNGTQDIFWNDPSVLYLSVHQYPFYPGSGDWRETGGDAAAGTTVNVPLPAGCSDAEYLATFDRLLMPLLRRFQPQLVLVSAGYDAHQRDPLASMALTTGAYAAMMARIRAAADDVADGHLVAGLEGGYDLPALSASVWASLETLLSEPEAERPPVAPDTRIETFLGGLRRLHGLPD